MRLVSAYYQEFYPFDQLSLFNNFIASSNPDDLTPDDCLVVWGGADIWPGFYKKNLSPMGNGGHTPSRRDVVEWAMMARAKNLGIPIIGICRGAQMLCALAGGYLMQHITGHGGNHEVVTNDGHSFQTNSLHHQMMVPKSRDGTDVPHELIAWVPELRSTVYWDEDKKVDHNQEPEFIYFNAVKGFAIQWHPEMMGQGAPATSLIYDTIKERIVEVG